MTGQGLGETVVNQRHRFWQGVWRIADPKITLASVASMVLGISAVAATGHIAWIWFLLTVLGIFFIEAAKNASGEVVDFDSGTDLAVTEEDRSPFSGGKRVLVDGLLSRKQTILVALVFYVLGAAVGMLIVFWREPKVLWIGLLGAALAYFYHAPPLKLSYRGLGELAVSITYGPLILVGTYLVQLHQIPWRVVWLSLPLGLLIGSFLWINEFPDARADASAGKRTWVVRLGRPLASRWFAVWMTLAFVMHTALAFSMWTPWILLGYLGLPTAMMATRTLLQHPENIAKIIGAQGQTLLSFVLMALGTSIGLWITRFLGG